MTKIIANPEIPLCAEDDHDWQYEAGDYEVGLNAGWVCTICCATHDGNPPEDDYPERYDP